LATLSSATGTDRALALRRLTPWASGLEVTLVFACILLYIWVWQRSHPLLWIPLLAFVIVSHVIHHDSPRAMGLTLAQIRPAAKMILPLAAAIYVPVVAWALATHRLPLLSLGPQVVTKFAGYAAWCCFQQYLVQCYFHRRLMSIMPGPHLRCVVVGSLFAAAHAPNAVLMGATYVGGIILAEVYEHYPNIWPLALAQAVGGMLIAALVPASIIHNMRVGPGYYTYRVR
jgi:hypothetical protein